MCIYVCVWWYMDDVGMLNSNATYIYWKGFGFDVLKSRFGLLAVFVTKQQLSL